jgi:hypothetical protein
VFEERPPGTEAHLILRSCGATEPIAEKAAFPKWAQRFRRRYYRVERGINSIDVPAGESFCCLLWGEPGVSARGGGAVFAGHRARVHGLKSCPDTNARSVTPANSRADRMLENFCADFVLRREYGFAARLIGMVRRFLPLRGL